YTARFAALLYLLYPAPYFLAPVLTNQHFAACMFLLAIFTLLEERINFALKGIASGLILSLGNAVRPLGIIIIAAVVIWAAIEAIRRKNFGTLGVVTITAIVYLIMNFTLSSMVKAEDINPEGLSNNYPLWKFVVGFNYETKGTFSYNDQNNIFYIQDFNKRNEVSKKVIEDRISISPGKMLNLLAIKQEVMWSSFDTLRWGFYDKVNKQLVPSQSVQKYEPSILRIEKMYYIMAFILMLIGLCLSVVRKKSKPGRINDVCHSNLLFWGTRFD
ncbi:MAG TPA: hypothetical protein VHP38_10325, partial [Ruminiclostridium sp.]|nr:hypothetical protein [Ruminiclostridium sp.]